LALTLTSRSALAAGDIDPARLRAADSEPQNWFTLGRDQNQTYFSPKIDASNVSRLGFAWAYECSILSNDATKLSALASSIFGTGAQRRKHLS
jgi:glucose dehydrogenase